MQQGRASAPVIDNSQRVAAKAAGALYLVIMAVSMISEFAVRSKLIVTDDAVRTAANIIASERLFRISIALDLLIVAGDVALIVALYVLLAPVRKNLALLGVFLRMIESAVLAGSAATGVIALRVLSGVSYLKPFSAEQLPVLARIAISARGAGFTIGFLFLGLGGMVLAYVLLKSEYVPRFLAGIGIFAYAAMVMFSLVTIVSPESASGLALISYVPAFVFEVGCGYWFLFKGIPLGPAVGSQFQQ